MTRLTRYVLLLGSALGFSMAAPDESHASAIPCIYNAVFNQLDWYTGYVPAPSSYGYGGYGSSYSSFYTPYTSYYAPYASTSYYANNCCASCCSSCGCSSGGCSSGNCASGNCSSGSCSNCTTNSAPTTAGYGSSGSVTPTPDYNNNAATSREVLHRLDELEHNQKEMQRFLLKQHPDIYTPTPYSRQNTTYSHSRDGLREEPVLPRGGLKSQTFDSDQPSADPFKSPRRAPAPDNNLLDEQDRRKIEINPPVDGKDKPTTPSNNTPSGSETEPQALRLDDRVTTQAVAPRERVQVSAKSARISLAKSNKTPAKPRLDSSLSSEVARY